MIKVNLEKALNAKRESKYVDFKTEFDINSSRDWCEIVKDIVAMSNSGGGVILIGARNDGTPSGWDPTPVLVCDPAHITDKIAKYTGEQFADFDISEAEKNGQRLAAFEVRGIRVPMIFIEVGTYAVGDTKQKTAFSRGSIYFRHGAKSEPGNSKDLQDCIDREIGRMRKSWLGDIRKIVSAPPNYQISVLPQEVVRAQDYGATPVRVVNDPSAPAYRRINPDAIYPHRRKEIVMLVNEKLGGEKKINDYDFTCVRRVHEIDQSKPEFFYKSKFGCQQYSNAFVDWLLPLKIQNYRLLLHC